MKLRLSRRISTFGRRWGALIVAVLALLTSVWSAYEDRRHKRLAVRPQIIISYYSNQNEAGWWMQNSGPGPAIFRRFEAYIDDKPQRSWDEFAATLGIVPPGTWRYLNPIASEIARGGSAMAPIFVVKHDNPAGGVVTKNWERVRIEVCYCSLYDECWEYSSRRGRKTAAVCEPPKFGEITWAWNAHAE